MSSKISILKSILTGSENSKFILIIGDYESKNPLPLTTAFLKSHYLHEKHIISPNANLPDKWTSLANIHDYSANDFKELISQCKTILTTGLEHPTVVILKDIDLLLWKSKPSSIVSHFKMLFSYPNLLSLVLIVNFKAHNLATVKSLQYLATTAIQISDCNADNSVIKIRCKIQHKKKSGKISSDSGSYLCHLSCLDFNLFSCCTTSGDHSSIDNNLMSDATQMNSLTTFNLDVNESEKTARSQLILPYIKSDDTQNEELQSGKVLYNPDQYDDIDEDDPDDDLDI